MNRKLPPVKTNINALINDNKILSTAAMRYMKARNKLFMLLYAENPNHWIFKEKYIGNIFSDKQEYEYLIEKTKKQGLSKIKESDFN